MWKETSAEVYAVIWARHRKDLSAFASFTDMSGQGYEFSTGHPEVLTEWGFKDSESPILKIVQRKEYESDKEWNVEYFIYVNK